MTKAGLYHYFPSKEAMLFEIMSFGMERMEDEVMRPASVAAEGRLEERGASRLVEVQPCERGRLEVVALDRVGVERAGRTLPSQVG